LAREHLLPEVGQGKSVSNFRLKNRIIDGNLKKAAEVPWIERFEITYQGIDRPEFFRLSRNSADTKLTAKQDINRTEATKKSG
jgi:hypothetical protein